MRKTVRWWDDEFKMERELMRQSIKAVCKVEHDAALHRIVVAADKVISEKYKEILDRQDMLNKQYASTFDEDFLDRIVERLRAKQI